MDCREDVREALALVNGLVSTTSLDVTASMLFLHALPSWISDELASSVTVLHHSLVAVPLGDHRHQAVARFYLVRLLLELEALVEQSDA